MRAFWFLVATVAVGAAWPSASAQNARDFRDFSDRLARIERDLRALERSVYARGGGDGGSRQAAGGVDGRFLDRLTSLEEEVRALTARVEDALYTVERLETRLDAMQEDLTFAMQGTDGGGGGTVREAVDGDPGQRDRDLGAGDAFAAARRPTDETRGPGEDRVRGAAGEPAVSGAGFDEAKSLLFQGDLTGARDRFRRFIDENPNDPRLSEARYWYGEALFSLEAYEEAARAFLTAVQTDPNGERSAESYLKLGMALGALGEKDDACDIFDDLPRRYGDAGTGVLRRRDLARDEIGCG